MRGELMTMDVTDYFGLVRWTAPEVVLTATLLAVLGVDVGAMRWESARHRQLVATIFAVLGCLVATAFVVLGGTSAGPVGGMLVIDGAARVVKAAILGVTLLTLLLTLHTAVTRHVGEFVALTLLASVGMMLLAGAENLLMIFLSLELTSLTLYTLTALSKERAQAAEAALKYFLFGALAAAFLLFGISLLYGVGGELQLSRLGAALNGNERDPLLLLALAFLLAGFGFKVAAVPFHLWAPDAYEGAPTPVAAFIASGSKVASFLVLGRTLSSMAGAAGDGTWAGLAPGWIPLIVVLAAGSMILGNLAAILQHNVKRLVAYSAIAHAGYALLAVAGNTSHTLPALVYYAVTYAFTVVGVFGVIGVIERDTGGADIGRFGGLARRSPALALCLLVCVLSLAGIPPLAGFFGKFYVFATAAGATKGNLGLLWLVALALGMSAVSLYYYLGILKQAYVGESQAPDAPVHVGAGPWAGIALATVAVVVLGCAPNWLLARLASGF
jgi:NADH-quinone oxidoreductase subunit N